MLHASIDSNVYKQIAVQCIHVGETGSLNYKQLSIHYCIQRWMSDLIALCNIVTSHISVDDFSALQWRLKDLKTMSKIIGFGHTKIIDPRPLGGCLVRPHPPGPASAFV